MSVSMIEYKSKNGWRGALYDPHECYGKEYFRMSITDDKGKEIISAYNATAKTMAELKKLVDKAPYTIEALKKREEEEAGGDAETSA